MISSCGQNSSNRLPDLVAHNGIKSDLHKANLGKITFMAGNIPIKEYQESDFLSSFEMKEVCDLNIRAFMQTSLTNYLHQLGPDLSVEELHQNGNYQFSFYIDDQLLYTENLNIYAGLPDQKNKNTTLRIPLISSTNEDSWGRFMWMRFYYRNGGEAALESGSHVLKIEMRPYLEMDKLLVGDIIAEGEINLKWADPEPVSEEQKAIQPIEPNSGWELSKDSYDEEKIRGLNEKIAQNKFKKISSVVVIKEGQLLIEEYFNGANRNALHNTRSVGKSFASTMTGIAIAEGHLKSTLEATKRSFFTFPITTTVSDL